MKLTLNEYDDCFGTDFQAETVAEAALLVRLGLNGVKGLRALSAYASKGGEVSAHVVIGKRRKNTGTVGHA